MIEIGDVVKSDFYDMVGIVLSNTDNFDGYGLMCVCRADDINHYHYDLEEEDLEVINSTGFNNYFSAATLTELIAMSKDLQTILIDPENNLSLQMAQDVVQIRDAITNLLNRVGL